MSTPTTEAARILTGKGRRRRGKPPGPARPAPAQKPAPAPRPAASKTAGPKPRARSTGPRRRAGTGFSLPGRAGDAHGWVVAEFVLCVVLLGATPLLTRKPDSTGKLYQANDFVRLTAVSLVFFVLALSANGQKSSRIAAAFGGLVTVGMLYNTRQSWAALGSIFVNQQQTKGNVATAPAGTADITVASYNPITDLGQGDPSTQNNTALSPGAQGGGAVQA